MRPTYETEFDLGREFAIAKRLAESRGLRARKLPKFYESDFAFCEGSNVKTFAEVKARNKSYDTLILSLHKWVWLKRTFETTGVPCLVVWSFPSGEGREVWYYPVGVIQPPIGWGGRWDRGDSEDMEPVVYLSKSLFKFAFAMEE